MITIYKIQCKDPKITDIYIGSTRDYKKRQMGHKSRCNNELYKEYNFKLYEFIRSNGSFDNFEFVVLNEIEYIDEIWKRKQEQCYIDSMKPSLNTYKAFGVVAEYRKNYYEANKEELIEKNRLYYKDNKEIISEKSRLYYKDNKEKMSEKNRLYREANKEAIIDYQKAYREANKDKIKERSIKE